VRRLGVALTYTIAFVLIDLIFRTRSAAGRAAWLEGASTNLANLAHNPVGALVASAFFAEGGLLSWAVLAFVGLGVVNWSLGNWRTAVLVGTAHVVGTLVSEGILWYRIEAGYESADQWYIVDVGPSYVVACALVAGIAYGPGAWRLLAAVGFVLVLPSLFGGLSTLEVSSVGHLCSVVIGLLLGWLLWRFAPPSRRSKTSGRPFTRFVRPFVLDRRDEVELHERQVTGEGSRACSTPRVRASNPHR
jgi:hypothetical protein